jgi:hypothetical protein
MQAGERIEPEHELWRGIEALRVSYADIADDLTGADVPWLDRPGVDETALDDDQRFWRANGYLHLPKFIPDGLIDAYCAVRGALDLPGGWRTPTPYVQVAECRDLGLYAPLMDKLESLIGGEMGMHLNLTGWVSTGRDWHQDDYLNPPCVNSWYAAVWIALDDIHPDAGPFQFVPGSHTWPLVRRDNVFAFLTPEQRRSEYWPGKTQGAISRAFEDEFARRGVCHDVYLPKKGDALIWHGRLAHRGSQPNDLSLRRKSFIAHYSSLAHRPDMPERARHTNGKAYMVFHRSLETGEQLPPPKPSLAERVRRAVRRRVLGRTD